MESPISMVVGSAYRQVKPPLDQDLFDPRQNITNGKPLPFIPTLQTS